MRYSKAPMQILLIFFIGVFSFNSLHAKESMFFCENILQAANSEAKKSEIKYPRVRNFATQYQPYCERDDKGAVFLVSVLKINKTKDYRREFAVDLIDLIHNRSLPQVCSSLNSEILRYIRIKYVFLHANDDGLRVERLVDQNACGF